MDPLQVAQALEAAEALTVALTNGTGILTNLISALKSGDQASLDAAHAQALALANSLKPAGAADLT